MPFRLLLLALICLAGCANRGPAPASYLLPADDAPLVQRIDRLGQRQPPQTSGLRLLPSSDEAFQARLEMIRAASVSLDLQYYIVEDGLTTRLLFDELLQAADRGVRVRLLLDDTTAADAQLELPALDTHPNLQVRLFNPLHAGRTTAATRALGRLLHLSQQHRRMHNKLLLADGRLAIVGGRNLGDAYFDADQTLNFTDIDLLAAGPVAQRLGESFDLYWNHSLSVPIDRLHRFGPGPGALQQARAHLRTSLLGFGHGEPERFELLTRYRRSPQLDGWLAELRWAPAQALWDAPDKILAEGEPRPELLLTTDLAPVLQGVSRELTLISAYFVPTEAGMRYFAERARDGVRIRILTNSLEATDVPAVHGGYAPYRVPLLELGAVLYELRRQPEQEQSWNISGSSESSLHSKAAMFDRRQVFIGSFNFDPRSVLWNTEVGVLIDSPELATEVQELTLEGMSPAISYEVRLADDQGEPRLVWLAEDHGRLRVLEEEPGGWWRRFNAWLVRTIGLERML
ncbi:phospholipase D family protein [Stutzerimonas azotifigens]|uniref:phospholipase D family protein n=1 Tax=Stutzerimonas azotifigens TaxID=291995 RepID=UPI000409DD7E|nr:phospholipase D family protein [Stutzerimonas azotifigens]